MKKIFRIITIFLFTSCSEDFLERTPLSEITAENFYKTEKDMIAAINAAYDPLQHTDFYRHAAYRWGAKTDEMFRAFDWYNFAYTPVSAASNNMWADIYQGVLFSNIVLQKLEDAVINEDLKNRIKGEAHFLRGFYYYHLVRWFGDVPIITTVPTAKTNFQVPRNPASEVFEFAINEFNEAIELLPLKSEYNSADVGRATKGAAQTMLADLYLYRNGQGDIQKVLELTEEVINSGQYELEENFSEIFTVENENGKESIFEVQFQSGGPGGGNENDGTQANTWIALFNSTSVQEPFFNNWNPTDIRREVSIIPPGGVKSDYRNNTAFYHQGKAVIGLPGPGRPAGAQGNSPLNYIVQRYANVLLMHAEALNELNASPPTTAVDLVNRIRSRVDLPPVPYDVSKSEFRNILREERKYELAFEGHRWFDLLRYERMGLGGGVSDILLDPASVHYNSNFVLPRHYLQPIPQTEIDRNPSLTQNPGY